MRVELHKKIHEPRPKFLNKSFVVVDIYEH